MKTKYAAGLRLLALGLFCANVAATNDGGADQQVQAIKRQALELNRDLLILEEELLYPVESRLTVYLSMDAGEPPSQAAISLSIDGVEVTHYQYTPQQLDALRRGASHRLFIGSMTDGEHQVVAELTGNGAAGSDYRERTELTVLKSGGASNLELKLAAHPDQHQARLSVREW